VITDVQSHPRGAVAQDVGYYSAAVAVRNSQPLCRKAVGLFWDELIVYPLLIRHGPHRKLNK
jgi:hypothetical protein